MNDVLYDFLDDFMVVYLDNIVVFSMNMADHTVYLSKVLGKFRENKLYVKREKCEFPRVKINHPQTDEQIERINALLKEYLRHYMTVTQQN